MSNRLAYRGSSALTPSPNLIPAGISDPRIKGDFIHYDNGQKVNWRKGYAEGVQGGKRAYTTDSLLTFDSEFSYTRDSTGAFLIGELERLDQTLHDPLVAVTWGRDIDLREDVTIADEVSSFTNSTFAIGWRHYPWRQGVVVQRCECHYWHCVGYRQDDAPSVPLGDGDQIHVARAGICAEAWPPDRRAEVRWPEDEVPNGHR